MYAAVTKDEVQRRYWAFYDAIKEVHLNTKTKTLIALAFLSLADMVIPIPILGIILLYVVIQKPAWFTQLSREIYGT